MTLAWIFTEGSAVKLVWVGIPLLSRLLGDLGQVVEHLSMLLSCAVKWNPPPLAPAQPPEFSHLVG